MITDNDKKVEVFFLGYFYDGSGKKTVEEVSKIGFSNKIPSQFALGYHSGNAWFKLTIHNKSHLQNFILNLTEPFWTQVDLYEFSQNQWKVVVNGLNVPIEQRQIYQSYPAFPLYINQNEVKTFYIKANTVSSFIGAFQIFTEKEFYRHGRFNIAQIYNAYSGILLFVLLLTGFLYFVIRERVYLYYIAYVFSFFIWINVQNGNYLYLGIPGWIHGLHAFGSLVIFFMVLFTAEILELKNKSPKISKFFNWSAAIILLCFVFISLDFAYINLFFNIYSSVFFLVLLYTSIQAWTNKYFTQARYYLIALVIYMPTMALMTMTYNGLIANVDFSRYAFAFGSLIEIIFFSFILVSHYYDSRQAKIQAQEDLFSERKSLAEKLKQEVSERTAELSKINLQLRQQQEKLEKSKQQLMYEASIDSLSELYNRRYFYKIAGPIFQESKNQNKFLSLLMIDIDRFKGINDNFGHDVGDMAIRSCSEVFKKLSSGDEIIARYGGEEFVILMPDSPTDSALKLAENIRKSIESSPLLLEQGKMVSLTLSIGIANMVVEQDKGIEDLLKRADKALYIAKNNGRNKVELV
ncbi:MAG: diguanylate cyclase [Gammaproteobacteria bacterium]|nr:diguanylate cyclase [Gammaproteobacteria bacterium]